MTGYYKPSGHDVVDLIIVVYGIEPCDILKSVVFVIVRLQETLKTSVMAF